MLATGRWCPNLLVCVYIAVVCAVLACERPNYVNRALDHTDFGPVVHSKEIFVIDGCIDDKEYSKVLEILQLRPYQDFVFSSATGRPSRHYDRDINGVIRKERASSEVR